MSDISRRSFLILGALFGGAAAVGVGPALIQEFAIPPKLSDAEKDKLFALARSHGIIPEFGIADDLPEDKIKLSSKLQSLRQEEQNFRYVSIFANLEDIYNQGRMQMLRMKIQHIKDSGSEVLLGLGPGAGYKPHPYDEGNGDLIKKDLERWVVYLGGFQCRIHVRWLFEAQILDGDIAHRLTPAISPVKHKQRYKELQELFWKLRREHGLVDQIYQHLAFAVTGYKFISEGGYEGYLGDHACNGVGVDIYRDIHGNSAVHWLLSYLLSKPYIGLFPNTALTDLNTASQRFGAPKFIYEYAIEHTGKEEAYPYEAPWIEALQIGHYADKGKADIYFGMKKADGDWRRTTYLRVNRGEIFQAITRV